MKPDIFRSLATEQLSVDDQQGLIDEIKSELARSSGEGQRYKSLEGYAEEIIRNGTPEQVAAAAEITLTGHYHGNPLPELLGRSDASDEYAKMQQFIGIAVSEPELAHDIVANNVAGFHASNSSSLLGVLKYGLLSSREARSHRLALGSGERTFTNHSASAPAFISFADWRSPETLSQYAHGGAEHPMQYEDYLTQISNLEKGIAHMESETNARDVFVKNARLVLEDTKHVAMQLYNDPDSLASHLIKANFPVLYGVDISGYSHIESSALIRDTSTGPLLAECVTSDSQGEFAIFNGNVPPESIPVIAVPEHWVTTIRELIHKADLGIDVYPLDALITRHRA